MLKVELTKNYVGITIHGDYYDLNHLYDSIAFLIHGEPENTQKYLMQNHLYGFLYEVRHAYQGQRESKLVDNSIDDDIRKRYNYQKHDITNKNMYFSFNYVLPDVLLDMILIKQFISEVDKNNSDVFNPHINYVNFFYSLILDQIFKILTPIKFKKIKKSLLNSFISDKIFYPQWFEIISLEYINSTNKSRQKNFMKMADSIINYYKYEDYIEFKKIIEKTCEEKNCGLDGISYENYPKEINW